MKKILMALLLVLLLASSASAYAFNGREPGDLQIRICTILDHSGDTYIVDVLGLWNRSLLDQSQVLQEIDGELIPAYPEIGSIWRCEGVAHWECPDLICDYVIDLIVLLKEIRP